MAMEPQSAPAEQRSGTLFNQPYQRAYIPRPLRGPPQQQYSKEKMQLANPRGLGKGLDALFADAEPASTGGEAASELPIADIEPDRNQPRREFDRQALNELADSIKEHGVLQPILVRPISGGGYRIVAGERRFRAAHLAGLTTIPAVVRSLTERETVEIALVENLQREDLNPVEEALGYRRLMEECGYTQEEAAQRVGKSRSAVANTMRLLTLPEEVLEMLKTGALTAGHAKAVLSVGGSPEEMTAAAKEIAKAGMSVRDAEKFARRRSRAPRSAKPRAKSSIATEVELSLKESLGVEVSVRYDKGRGSLTINFYSKEQLMEFANKLGK